MNKPVFRRPEEIKGEEPREPISGRVRRHVKEELERAAKRSKPPLSLSELVGEILEDYVKWLKTDR